jgi:murein DD-endopeptidase MepM/ murein hydrolase activator NlpD
MKVAVFPVLGPCWFGDTWQAPRSGGRQHQGVDIIAKSGTPLYAANNGRISRQSFDRVGSLGGNTITLTAADGTYFFYAHLSTFADGIAVGSEVVAGQVIGYVGNTGSSSTPHLHFEYHPYGGAAVNPYPPVKAIDGCKITTPPTTIPPTTTIAP